MLRFIVRILGNAVALYIAFFIVPGFIVSGFAWQYLIAGAILAVLNLVVRPILKLISFPLIILTLGAFTFVINMIILWLLDAIVAFIAIESLIALILATVVISIVNIFFSLISETV
ncbi:MAG: hypothetical protein UY20_C0018G0005 [Candidatus Yanofskybacteria bacterium GW2011_GWA1_48_10]|uniref:Integral membrane protein n=2 Tax=Candidatus Yanofskyibacteriota TaxID=1752733 RepID=A0A0G1WFB3_9BACT|nr:MAG: hypothetical protein UY20_C0018G0005 [Candidatus Yanofskybacteria bacterium GW2011_GWA1_48_10]OGN06709.1 MAG: hypothetical protein A2669_00015 [Candidatus Yanofskybacteria bacterium RIFCSPHIGHO2_01_FULL_48_25b]